jgi:hypothetical protein
MNRRLFLAALVLPALAFAQLDDDETEVGASAGGMNIKIKVKDGSRHQTTTAHEEQKGDGFHIVWDTDPDGDTWFKVLAPEGAQIRVLDDVNFPKASGTIPVSFRASGKKFYLVEIRTPNGTFTKKFEAKSGMIAQLWVGGPKGPAPVPVAVVGPCGPDSDLRSVMAAISEESFSAGKLRVLEDAASARGFCVDHAVQILNLYDFENDKLSALKLLAPRLTDRQNKFKIYKAFDFDNSRDQAKKILQ